MKNSILFVMPVVLLLLATASFRPQPSVRAIPPDDSTLVSKGASTFNKYCTGCHNFRQDGIGPQLGGITTAVTPTWIRRFILDPQKLIHAGDKRATQLIAKYKVVMPSFSSLSEKDLDGLLAFLDTRKPLKEQLVKGLGAEINNPVAQPVKVSGLVAGLQLVTQFPPSLDSGKLPAARITKLDYQPETNALFIVDLRGKLFQLINNEPVLYLDIAKQRPSFIDKPGFGSGFGSFAFHPDFATNGLLYTTHTEKPNAAPADFAFEDSIKVTLQWVLTEWKTDHPGATTFSGTGRELLRVNMVAPNHGVQDITFNRLAKKGDEDYGMLFIGIGDGGAVENGYPSLVHSTSRIWGSVLRINPTGRNSTNGKYGIPAGNPFVGKGKNVLGEIYAYGFRNPHRITWSQSKQMLVFNIGHGNIESIDLVVKGHFYGWPIREGTFMLNTHGNLNKVFALPANDAAAQVTYPVVQYDHDEGRAICGGYEYTGASIPALNGKVLFGDIPLGRLFYTDMASMKQGSQALVKEWQVSVNGKVQPLTELCGSSRVDLHFGKDAAGELYILTKADGRLYKIVSAEQGGMVAVNRWPD